MNERIQATDFGGKESKQIAKDALLQLQGARGLVDLEVGRRRVVAFQDVATLFDEHSHSYFSSLPARLPVRNLLGLRKKEITRAPFGALAMCWWPLGRQT